MSSHPLLSFDEEQALARLAQSGCRKAEAELIRCNQGLVIGVARRYHRMERGIPLWDLIQEGNLALLRSLRRFEPDRGLRLNTYAMWEIRRAIAYAAGRARMIRVPAHTLERQRRCRRFEGHYQAEHGKAPTSQELAELVNEHRSPTNNVETDSSVKALLSLADSLSLDQLLPVRLTYRGEPSRTLADSLTAPESVDRLEIQALQRDLQEAMECLTVSQARVVALRYGLGSSGHELTFDEIGRRCGVTGERARQIHNEAMKGLKGIQQLKEYLR